MTTAPTSSSTDGVDGVAWRVPRLRSDDRLVGGVASGIAEELGVAPLFIRGMFVVLATAGWGIVLYAVAWIAMALTPEEHRVQAGGAVRAKGANPTTRVIGVGLVFGGLLLLFRTIDLGFSDAIVWPIALITLGTLVAWHRGIVDVDGSRPMSGVARIGLGLVLSVGGLVLLITTNLDRGATLTAIGAVVVVAAGLAVVIGPWVWRTLGDLTDERRRRIRSEERADVAAHLHDSVLQTLSLIQRRSDDPAAMVSLARRQERELRNWLFTEDGPGNPAGTPFRRSIAAAAAGVEETHHVPIEVVTVGDLDMGDDERLASLVAAAREAMTNAARHSGASSIDVYAEVDEAKVEVFVRDTGTGFDPATVAEDRRGIADSIQGRLRRAGGWATIDTTEGEGTEVALGLDRRAEP